MKIENHQAKAVRIERSLAKCTPNDFEIKIEGAMLAATHWANLVFHSMCVTDNAQDIMHSYLLTVNEHRRLSIANERIMTLLGQIEDIRPVYVRGDAPGGAEKADIAIDLLGQIRSIALDILNRQPLTTQ